MHHNITVSYLAKCHEWKYCGILKLNLKTKIRMLDVFKVIPLFKDVNPDSDKNYKFYFQYFEILCDVYTRIPCVRQIVIEITDRRGVMDKHSLTGWAGENASIWPVSNIPNARMTQLTCSLIKVFSNEGMLF